MLPLITVVGNVEPELFREFVRHYRGVGATDILVGFHFTDDVPRAESARLIATCVELAGPPRHVGHGGWHEETNGLIRDKLRAEAGSGWHVIADVDEFHHYPGSVGEAIALAEDAGEPTIEGLLFDRVSATGELGGWDPGSGIDRAYPLGGFFTHRVVGGDSRKVMAARAEVHLSSGNHWAPGLRIGGAATMPLPVHHFKWRAGCARYLARRARGFARSTVPAEMAMARECGAVLDHLAAHGGRIATHDGDLGFRPCRTSELPPQWASDYPPVFDYWWRTRWI